MPRATQAAARNTSPKRIDAGGSVASRTLRPAGRPQQHQPDDLDEAEDGERSRRRQAGEGDRSEDAVQHAPVGGYVQERLQGEPFGGEAVQRRQPGDGRRSDEERCACPRHAPQQAAEPIELERSHGLLERTCAEKEERLEDGVIDRVEQGGRQCERRPLVGTPVPAAAGRRRDRAG